VLFWKSYILFLSVYVLFVCQPTSDFVDQKKNNSDTDIIVISSIILLFLFLKMLHILHL